MNFRADIPLQQHSDDRGALVALEAQRNIPFEIKRVYYIYATRQDVRRGFHAHKALRQMVICVAGSCRFLLDDGHQRHHIQLNDPAKGLLLEGMIWREMYDFSPDCVLLILANEYYDDADYIRDYSLFRTQARASGKHQDRPKVNTLIGKNLNLRTARPDDAPFILALRTQAHKARHLSTVANDLTAQRSWLESYQERERQGQEYYFVIEDKQQQPLGLVRVYDLKPHSFCWGSWIISDHAPTTTAIESALQVYEFGFGTLGYQQAHFDVRKANTRVIAFHQRLGATIVDEDQHNYYFHYRLADYQPIRQKYRRYLP